MSGAAAPARLEAADGAALVGLLDERAAIYDGLGSAEAERLRAQVFAALAGAALPASALPFVLEELETGMDAVATAAAAMALRRAARPGAEAEALLLKAIDRLALADVPFPFRPGRTALEEALLTLAGLPGAGGEARAALRRLIAGGLLSPTARVEAERTLAALPDRAATALPPSCCGPGQPAVPAAAAEPGAIRLQDQDGARLSFGDFFVGRPSVAAFFYTRCMNPERCSLTVAKLARLQAAAARRGLAGRFRIAAISYDPGYDLPSRLVAYGLERGFAFDADNRFFRTEGPADMIRDLFDLGVGYGPSTVNRHRLELFVLDEAGAPVRSFTRRLWAEEEVLAAVEAGIAGSEHGQRSAAADADADAAISRN
jgi:cytochrome oxidase Cu insertion factor (SCO1/SenC/PrrC family)